MDGVGVRTALARLWANPATAAFWTTRLALWLVAYVGLVLVPMGDDPGLWRGAPDNLLLDGWTRWDAGWYRDIALLGYDNVDNAAGQRDTAFFPAYPMLVGAVTKLGVDVWLAGIAASNLAFLVGLWWLHALVEDRFGCDAARRSVWLVAVFPFSFVFTAMYTEALFFMASVGAVRFAERNRWPIAGLLAALAGATRSAGCLVAIVLLGIWLAQRKRGLVRRGSIVWVAAAGLGPLLFMIYLAVTFGEPLAFVTAQDAAGWAGREATWTAATDTAAAFASVDAVLAGRVPLMHGFNLVVLGGAALTTGVVWRQWGSAYGLWTAALVGLGALAWPSMGRHVATMFPLLAAIAVVVPDRTLRPWLAISVAVLAVFTLAFTHFHWVA